MTENLLTVEAVATYFSVSKATIRRWERTGELKGIRIAGSLRFECAAIREFIQAETAKHETVTA